MTLNNNKRDAAQLREQNELLNSIIKNNIRKLSVINCTIDKVPDEMFGLRGIYFLDSTVTPDDIQNIPQETEMVQIQGQHEDGNLAIRYTESAINKERKERIRRIAKEIYKIENKVNKNDIINYLNSYKNRIVSSNSDLNVIEKNRTEESNKLEYLRNLLSSLQAIDDEIKNLNLDGLISRIRDQREEWDHDPLLRRRDRLAGPNPLADMINNFDFDNLGNNSTDNSDTELSSSDSDDF